MDVVIDAENKQYEKQLNGRMQRLLNTYLAKFINLPIDRKEEIVKDVASHVGMLK